MIFQGEPLSLVSYAGYNRGHCGYCGRSDGSESFGLVALSLSVHVYQALIDRGWRRSGTYIYKPNLRTSCCKLYTIRLDAESFAGNTSKDQRQALHKFNRVVLGQELEHTLAARKQKALRNVFSLQSSVHAAEYSIALPSEPDHKLTITLALSKFSQEKFLLFQAYQRSVHRDRSTERGFKRFLCDSPLEPIGTKGDCRLMGSYHQEYRLDGILIAVGFLDLLPHGVSSVYFIYHPDFASMSLGRVSACREACLAEEKSYRCYYMGFYIQTCQKMRYKGEYKPSFLLDPESYDWIDFQTYSKALKTSPYYTFQPSIPQADAEGDDEVDLLHSHMPGIMGSAEVLAQDHGKIHVLDGRTVMPAKVSKRVFDGHEYSMEYTDFVSAVGSQLATEIVLVI